MYSLCANVFIFVISPTFALYHFHGMNYKSTSKNPGYIWYNMESYL